MIATQFFDRYVIRNTSIPALSYGGLIAALIVSLLFAVIDVLQRHHALMESAELVARFEHRTSSPNSGGRVTANQPQGSPFLEGETLTIASAALLQRVTEAIARAGGSVVSSEVAPQGSHAADGLVRITATCELEQKALQGVLYDIEAGMPFLFVDQLLAQAPPPESQSGRMRVVLEVSGLWAGGNTK